MRALLSVSDKTGLVDFAKGLADLGVELVSSGGTAAVLTEAGLSVSPVAEVTGSPEMLDGRVKTLHPRIHGAILADRSKPTHMAELDQHEIAPIDLVVSNLYPFVAAPGIENIDIGGPTMVRAAAKNHDAVTIVVDPSDYEGVLDDFRAGGPNAERRRELARKAFAHTASYDAAIVTWLDSEPARGADPAADTAGDTAGDTATALPDTIHLSLTRVGDLRYGENPHQQGARYRHTHGEGWWDHAVVHQGKAMSYLNVYDTEAAWSLVNSLGTTDPAVAVIKHANPCGVAIDQTIEAAYARAHACDPVSAFGGIVAANRTVTTAMAQAMIEIFTEVVVAPNFEPGALETFTAKPNLRVVETGRPDWGPAQLTMRTVSGGLLVQTEDWQVDDESAWSVATERSPSDAEWADLRFAWAVAARVASNCIVLAKDLTAVGIGAGQQNRRDAGIIAADKADGRAVGGACASDAFFPFRDGLDAAVGAGATAVVQPGGSIRDDEVIAAANEAGLAMVFTGRRHFRH